MCCRFSVAVVSVFVFGVLGMADRVVAQETAVPEQRQELLVKLARQHTLTAPESGKTFRLSKQPVVHYTNPVRDRGTSDGVTMLWLEREIPIAVSSFSIRRPDDSLRYECTSFSEAPLLLRHGGTMTWAPATWQTAPKPMPGVAAPGPTPTRRLLQMRQICRKFEAKCTRRSTNEVASLRLLPQPLYRFRDDETGIADGALFAFVISNDPELLLRLEAVEKADTLAWRYSFARMTSLQVDVLLDGVVDWQVPNFYEQGKSMDQAYIEGGLSSIDLKARN